MLLLLSNFGTDCQLSCCNQNFLAFWFAILIKITYLAARIDERIQLPFPYIWLCIGTEIF